MAEQAVEKKTAIQFILKNGRAGCANKTAIQYACLAHYFPLFWRELNFSAFCFNIVKIKDCD